MYFFFFSMKKKKELTFKGGSMLGRERRLLALVAAGAAHLSPAIATNPASSVTARLSADTRKS